VVVEVSKSGASLVPQHCEGWSHLVTDVEERFTVDILEHRIVLFGIGTEVVDVTVRGVKVLPPVVIVVDKSDTPTRERQAQGFEVSLSSHVVERIPNEVAEEAENLPSKVVVDDVDHAVVIKILGIAAHSGNGSPCFVVGHAVERALFLECAVPLIDEEKVSLGVIRDKNIHQPVAVEIGDVDSHAFAESPAKPGSHRHVLEVSMTQVVVEPLSHALVNGRTAINIVAPYLAAAVSFRSPLSVG